MSLLILSTISNSIPTYQQIQVIHYFSTIPPLLRYMANQIFLTTVDCIRCMALRYLTPWHLPILTIKVQDGKVQALRSHSVFCPQGSLNQILCPFRGPFFIDAQNVQRPMPQRQGLSKISPKEKMFWDWLSSSAHQRAHNNANACNVGNCPRAFKTKKDLSRHQSTVHKDKFPTASTFTCVCGHSTTRKDNYERHVKSCQNKRIEYGNRR